MSMDVLQAQIRARKNPTVLSLEPGDHVIPGWLKDTFAEPVERCRVYCRSILEALAELIPGVRVSIASFLALGTEGLALMKELLDYAGELGYYRILDNLPDSWGSVSSALAPAVLGPEALWPCESVVLNGYCGTDGIKPYLPWCKEGKSLFVLVKSPNRSSVEIQDMIFGGRVVHTAMADLVNRWGAECRGTSGYNQVGALVGATYPEVLRDLRSRYDRVFQLVTGLEIQGASPKGCQYAFDRMGHGAAVCASGYILGAWARQDGDGHDYVEKAREAALRLKKNLANYVTVL